MNDSKAITIPKIRTYNDFITQLRKAVDTSSVAISYYKYCWIYDANTYEYFRDLILREIKQYNLTPYKVTDTLNLIFRFKKKTEAIMYIKEYGADLIVLKK